MLKASMISAMVLMTGLISHHVNAALIATDWKSGGDTLATLDTRTGLEWLDLLSTVNQSYQTVLSRVTNGDLKGWRFPTEQEMDSFFKTNLSSQVAQLKSGTGFVDGALMNDDLRGYASMFGGTQLHAFFVYGLYKDSKGKFSLSGYRDTIDRFAYRHYDAVYNAAYKVNSTGWFLVSDGGTTLSSINNPALNINNPNSPVNQAPDAPADVSVHAGFGLLSLLLMALGFRRRASA